MTFDEIKKEYQKDSKIDKSDLVQASIDIPKLYNKYLQEMYNTKDQLLKSQYNYNILYKEKWMYYTGKASAEVYKEKPFDLKVLKSDLSIFIESDKEIQDYEYKIKFLSQKESFIKDVLKEISSRSFTINNINRTRNFENGII